MAGTWTRRGRTPAAAVLLAVLAVPIGTATPAVARECTGLAAAATSTGGRTQVLLSLPAALTGAALTAGDVSLVQDGLDLPVLSVADVPATATDVVVVVDTSSASAPSADGVRAATTALLQGLAAPTRVAVLSTGGAPTVVQPLVRGPRVALPAVADLVPGGANAVFDTLLAGVRLLPADPGRQQQVVVVAAGADSGSASSWAAAEQLLVRRGVALDVVDLGGSPSLPRAGAQCPGTVAAAAAAGAARTLAQQLQDRRLVLVPTLTGTDPVQVSVTHAGTTASTTLTTRADAGTTASAPAASDDRGGAGAGTLVLAFLVGILGLLVLLLVVAVRSTRGGAVRAAVRELWDARRPGRPEAEAVRRRTDARVDLHAALGGGPTAVQRAEMAAHDEAVVRAVEEDHRRAAEERTAAYARAAERRERSRQQAERWAATERAAREATARLDLLRPLPATGLAGADPAAQAVLAEAEHAVTAQRLAAEEAMTRRAEAERLADEAEARAERERVAAAEAQRTREVAEAAAAEAAERAQEELRTAGAASKARLRAEEQARVAAIEAAEERRAAEEAVARRMLAEAQAADAEAAEDAAVHRELAALEAAEAAEDSHREAVARLAPEPDEAADPAGAAPSTVDLRPASLVVPAVDTATRRPVVAPLESRRGAPGGAGTGRGDKPVARPDGSDGTAAPELGAPPFPPRPSAADMDRLPDGLAVRAGPEVADLQTAAPAGPPLSGRTAARAVAVLLVPAAALLRAAVASWSGIGAVGTVLLAVAGVLTVLGLWWTWLATTPPYALRRRTALRILASEQLRDSQTEHAARLLAAIGDGTADQAAWDDFEQRTGLVVQGGTRTAVQPGMDPAALVRYLSARQSAGLPTAQPLLVVTAVPLLTCLLPAALLVLVS